LRRRLRAVSGLAQANGASRCRSANSRSFTAAKTTQQRDS
jgi:hypothetical protein